MFFYIFQGTYQINSEYTFHNLGQEHWDVVKPIQKVQYLLYNTLYNTYHQHHFFLLSILRELEKWGFNKSKRLFTYVRILYEKLLMSIFSKRRLEAYIYKKKVRSDSNNDTQKQTSHYNKDKMPLPLPPLIKLSN